MKAVVGHTVRRQVAFVGPFGVGKTTAVRAISDTKVLTTEVRSSAISPDTRVGRKLTTTVGLDYGEWRAPDGAPVAVVGTPGQARFTQVRRSVMPRTTRLVLWMYGQNDYALEECKEWLEFIRSDKAFSRLTVAVTRTDDPESAGPPLEEYRPLLDGFSKKISLVKADPRQREDVIRVVLTALQLHNVTGEVVR